MKSSLKAENLLFLWIIKRPEIFSFAYNEKVIYSSFFNLRSFLLIGVSIIWTEKKEFINTVF